MAGLILVAIINILAGCFVWFGHELGALTLLIIFDLFLIYDFYLQRKRLEEKLKERKENK